MSDNSASGSDPAGRATPATSSKIKFILVVIPLGLISSLIAFGYFQWSYQHSQKQASSRSPAEWERLLGLAATDSSKLVVGKSVYLGRCISCHGSRGEGSLGPNLTDDYWISGDGSLESILSVILNGVPAQGMPSWAPVLSDEELLSVAVFVKSLKGTRPPNPKAPQGMLRQ